MIRCSFYVIHILLLLYHRPEVDAIWTPAQISILGEWSLENGTEVMYTELYSDMRRADAATWIPDSEMIVETLNQTGFGCLELSANGLYGVKLQEGCEEQLRPSCEYTGKSLTDISLTLKLVGFWDCKWLSS